MLKRIDIKVGFYCNNHCLFCVQWKKREKFLPKSFEEICQKLEKWRADEAFGVVFTWWEPTLHPDLLESVKYAKKLGYQFIQIQSNWRNFSDMEYCKKLIEAWVTEFGPSMHGFTPETHDALVWAEGAWKQTVQWMKNLRELWQKVLINSVITKQNYKDLPKMAMLWASLWVRQFQFAFIHIAGSAKVNQYEIVAKKTDIMPYVKKWLDIGRKYGMVCMTEAIPFCLMQGYEWAIAEYNYMPETEIFDAESEIESYNDYRKNEWKKKREECKSCKFYKICEWPWKEYPELYGRDEFVPIEK